MAAQVAAWHQTKADSFTDLFELDVGKGRKKPSIKFRNHTIFTFISKFIFI